MFSQDIADKINSTIILNEKDKIEQIFLRDIPQA
jgi:hypothetical protein